MTAPQFCAFPGRDETRRRDGAEKMIRRKGLVLAFGLGLTVVTAGPVLAQSCGDDMTAMSQQRQKAMMVINAMVEGAKGKQIDPNVFCSRSQPLNAIENKMLAYMSKNKDWCQIPDEVMTQLRDAHAKTVSFSGRACKAAADMKKAQAQGGSGAPQVQPLPAGPL